MAAGSTEPRRVILGRVTGAYGVKGWLKVHSYTEPREAILEYPGWALSRSGAWQDVEVAEGRRHGKTVIAKLAGVDDRDEAAACAGSDVGVARDALPLAGEGEFYWADLEGLEVVRQDGRSMGNVDYLLETGANDVLVVKGEQEILVPFVMGDVIREVDLEGGVIRVDWEWD